MERPIEQLLLEYQDYILADRLKRVVGGKLRPRTPKLSLADYARVRLRRMDLARKLVTAGMSAEELSELDALTETMNYGFWYNPGCVSEFLNAALFSGNTTVFYQQEAFLRLLSDAELERLGAQALTLYTKHAACFRLATPGMNSEVLESIYQVIERSHIPLFIDELQ